MRMASISSGVRMGGDGAVVPSSSSVLLQPEGQGDIDVLDEHEEEVELAVDRLEQVTSSVSSSSSSVRSIGRSALPTTTIGGLVSVSLSTSRGLTARGGADSAGPPGSPNRRLRRFVLGPLSERDEVPRPEIRERRTPPERVMQADIG
jgi:hypothetical protein